MSLRKQTSRTQTPPRHETPEEQEIKVRAYELYEQRGRQDGHDVDDWLQAESELNNQHWKAVAA